MCNAYNVITCMVKTIIEKSGTAYNAYQCAFVNRTTFFPLDHENLLDCLKIKPWNLVLLIRLKSQICSTLMMLMVSSYRVIRFSSLYTSWEGNKTLNTGSKRPLSAAITSWNFPKTSFPLSFKHFKGNRCYTLLAFNTWNWPTPTLFITHTLMHFSKDLLLECHMILT